MRKILMTTVALAALGAATPLFAANDATTPVNPVPAAPSMQDNGMKSDTDQMKPMNPSAAQNAAPADQQQPMFASQQETDQLLASNLIGADVKDANGDSLGSVSDLVLTNDGSVQSIIIGVGGFLGIGTKDVAVAYDEVQSTTAADGSIQLSLNVTKDQLNSAPDFKTLDDQNKDHEAAQPTTQPVTPAPSNP